MYNPTSVLENDTHKHLCALGIQTDHLISARTLDLIIINKNKKSKSKKENLQNCRFCSLGWTQKLKESEKKDKYLDFARDLKKNLEHEIDVYTNVIGALDTVT